jgi:hypothetical protein
LDLEILGDVNTHLVDSYKFILIFFNTYKFKFYEVVSQYHVRKGITRYIPGSRRKRDAPTCVNPHTGDSDFTAAE